jgi:hypothetical protein
MPDPSKFEKSNGFKALGEGEDALADRQARLENITGGLIKFLESKFPGRLDDVLDPYRTKQAIETRQLGDRMWLDQL